MDKTAFDRIKLLTDEEVRILHAVTPAQKLTLASEMTALLRDNLKICLQSYHPDWNERQLTAEAMACLSRANDV